jgi:5-methyltetrahydrofolate--homocysteine methyltransferase
MSGKLLNKLKEGILLFDGAMGTELQKRDLLAGGKNPELLNLQEFESIKDIHRTYIEAGARVITTNTFGGNSFKLRQAGIEDRLVEVNREAVRAASEARDTSGIPDILIAGSVGPLGELMSPLGDLTWDGAVDAYKTQIKALSGADIVLLETFTDIHELRAAAFAAKAVTDLEVIACVALDESGQLLTGGDVLSLAVALSDLGVFALGLNCGLTPLELFPFFKKLSESTDLPLLFQANCGMPEYNEQAGMTHSCHTEDFANQCIEAVNLGTNMLGGCCGSGPEHIRALSKIIEGKKGRSLYLKKFSEDLRVGGRGKTATIKSLNSLTIIGERINPTGRKAFARELREGNLSGVRKDALSQARQGADIIDVNVGTSGVIESEILPKAVESASGVNLPICIDTSDISAMEAALKVCPGKALLNSASAESNRIDKVFKLAFEYGAAVICLPVNDAGLPESVEDRISILKEMIAKALQMGIKRNNLLLDGLVTTLGASPVAALDTLQTISAIKNELQLPSVLGVGNISHGLPGRNILTATFLSMAAANGLSAAIINPDKEEIYLAATSIKALLGDRDAISNFINVAQNLKVSTKLKSDTGDSVTGKALPEGIDNKDSSAGIFNALVDGLKSETETLVTEALKEGRAPSELLNQVLIPAMNEVGRLFGAKRLFLPGLLASAEAMEAASTIVKDKISKLKIENGGETDGECKEINVILASVKGDIHDIGKNIVKLMLKNSGCIVHDLGKDVATSSIIEECMKIRPDIIALSALMTTTMVNMKDVAREVKERGLNIPIIVGGAVVNQHFAESIGAAYAADAAEAVKEVFNLAKGKK